MAAKLVAEEGNLKGLVLSLDEGEQWIIGRDPDACQLLIEDPSASRRHLLCRNTPEGIVVENLSATNPVQVNEEEVKEPRLLQTGDSVKIGSGVFRFYAEAAAQLIKEDPVTSEPSASKNGTEHPAENLPQAIEDVNIQQEAPQPMANKPQVQVSEIENPVEERHNTIFDEENPDDKNVLAEIDFGLVDTGRWLLKVIGGPNNGAEFSMQSGSTYIIGTDPNSCDIVFHDTSVSRQHAKLTFSQEDAMTIEDLKSRNGTLLDGVPLQGKQPLPPNTLVSMGTTSFVVYDREGEMQTIISPLMPSIVKVLQKEEPKKEAVDEKELEAARAAQLNAELLEQAQKEKANHNLGAFILIGIITGLFVIAAIGTSTLFKSEPVINKEVVDTTKALDDVFAPFPSVKYTFNKNSGRLFLVGHVITASDKNQLLNNLQGLKFIKSIEDTGIVIDEYVWREINQVLEKNPSWKGITVHSPSPGKFVLSGYLQTKSQADRLSEYITANFPYLDLLEKRVVVDEEIVSTINNQLQTMGFNAVQVQLASGEVTLTGGIPPAKAADFNALVADIKNIPGIRGVKNFVTNLAPESATINISDKYEVTGVSTLGAGNLSVVINGRILTKGDILDGMSITSINRNMILLEKDGVKYRIDYSK